MSDLFDFQHKFARKAFCTTPVQTWVPRYLSHKLVESKKKLSDLSQEVKAARKERTTAKPYFDPQRHVLLNIFEKLNNKIVNLSWLQVLLKIKHVFAVNIQPAHAKNLSKIHTTNAQQVGVKMNNFIAALDLKQSWRFKRFCVSVKNGIKVTGSFWAFYSSFSLN